MSHIMKLKSLAGSSFGLATGAVLFAALATIMVLVPRINSVSKAESCPNPPDHAVLNYWPVSFEPSQTGCTDFTTVDGHLVSGGSYSTSQADYDNGLQMADGDEAYIRTYVHNGAAQNGDPNQTTAQNVQLDVSIANTASADHGVTASWHGSNTNTASGTFVLHTPANRTVEIVPNSGELFDAFGNRLAANIDLSSGHYTLGNQQACFEFARFLRFKVRMVNAGAPTLSITKQVRNVTRGESNFSSSTNASTGDTVQYQIRVSNTGSAVANNTTVTDTGTNGTTFVAGSLQTTMGTGSTIPGTINIGNLPNGQSATITYNSTVTGGAGSYVNTATAQATGISPVTATATVNVSVVNNTNNAECVAVTLSPASPFSPNQAFTGTITVRNNGSTTWVPANGYALGSQNPQDNTTWGSNRINLGTPVAPGQQAILNISTHAPATSGTYNFAWQMVQNGQFFGAICQTPVVVNPVQPQNTTLALTKNVRNVTQGTGYQKTVSANTGDTVQYEVRIRNTGSVTARTVTLTDNGTSGTQFISGSIDVNPAPVNTSLALGTIPGTLNLGDLTAGQEMVVHYSMRVTGGPGTYPNTATAQASNTNSASDTAQVIVNPTCTNNCGGTYSIAVDKQVRNLTNNGSYSNSASAVNGDRVQFQIVVTNTGTLQLNNVRLSDVLPSGLNLDNSSLAIDGTLISSSDINNVVIGTLAPGARKTFTFVSTVSRNVTPCTSTSLQNIARASADSVSTVQDDAFVTVGCVQGSNINLVFSKKAWNDTKNVDATSTNAAREDFITYTLTVTNTGNSDAANFVITDDLSGVLPYADFVDNGQGGTLSGNVITFPAVTVPAGGTVTKTFRVRVKYSLSNSLTYQLRNTYGNTVLINVGSVLGASTFVAPVTGATGQAAVSFAGLLVAGFVAYKKRSFLKKLILA